MKKRLPLIILSLAVISYSLASTELTGDLSKEDIINNFPSWEERAAGYIPHPVSIAKLQAYDSPVHIEVYLGTWCPDSVEHVSSFFKIIDMADNPFFIVAYTGIPREKQAREVYIRGKDIQKVPTFIVLVDNQEIGRIIEHPKKSVEEDLIDILASQIQTPD